MGTAISSRASSTGSSKRSKKGWSASTILHASRYLLEVVLGEGRTPGSSKS
ncbi:MAG: hypothetical protein R2716_11385 [Microthrixaceae bacterium]